MEENWLSNSAGSKSNPSVHILVLDSLWKSEYLHIISEEELVLSFNLRPRN
jgi:hypothetical protein